MQDWLEFARGPLFRFTLAVMLLGMVRIVLLEVIAAVIAYRKAGDKTLPWGFIFRRTLQWFFPVQRLLARRPLFSVVSVLFHVGLLLVPIFLFAHIELWRGVLGFGWPALPKPVADWLTIGTIVAGAALVVARLSSSASRFLSRKQDFFWPPLILLPFISGYACANWALSPGAYQVSMLLHVVSAEMIFVLLPFTKIAHCVLMPFSQIVSNLAWKFPPETDDDVSATLNKRGAPV